MSIQKKILIAIIVFLNILLSSYRALAISSLDGEIEISQDYMEYLGLENKSNVIAPTTYEIPKDSIKVTNPLKLSKMLRSSTIPKYSLRDVIPENMIIKNQNPTNTCWTFASLAALESHLALQDYKKGITTPIIYDFSERHMDYATSRAFLNNQINEFGFNKTPGSSGPQGMALAYLTNGLGAISEKEMEFQPNSELIDISEIQNKNVITQVNDIVTFPTYSATDDKTEIIKKVKQHIMDYGGIDASIHMAFSNVYNSETGALYCNNSSYKINHAITIVGWDDEYATDNFIEGNQPENPGAWIIKNSYGTEIGDEGYIYVSYEDSNIYKSLTGIENAQTEVTYENIYQYDEFGGFLKYKVNNASKIYLATEFDKKTEGKEYLTQVSIFSPETYTCKVYVNPNGTSKEMKYLQQVLLKTGETETFNAGYHTLEFLNPIKIGDNFVVVLEIQGTQENSITMMVEINYGEFFANNPNAANHVYDNVTIADEKCFIATEEELANNEWRITSKSFETSEGKLPNFDTTIKAFTTSKVLENIEIKTPPTNTSYTENQDFDATGMSIIGNYANGDTVDITDFTILNGKNLSLGQTEVTISYKGFTVTQPIEVVKNTEPVQQEEIVSISVKNMPFKTEYLQNKEDLDLKGGIINILYNDGTEKEMPMTANEIMATGFNNEEPGTKSITLTYKGKTTQFDVKIKELEKPTNSSFDNIQGNIKRVRAYYFTDKTKKEYVVIDVEISNVVPATGNDKTEYYYSLSQNPNDGNINDWIKIEQLNFEINTLNISNYDELANANKIYLYVKEVAIKNDMKSEKISNSLILDIENMNIEEYIDGEKKADVSSDTITDSTPGKDVDNTLAPEEIPYAGQNILILFLGLAIFSLSILSYLRYKDIEIK